jgi:pilus assembly protein FimV
MAINKNKLMDAARKARDKGQVDKAIKEYLKIVREDPKDVRVWLKIGDLYAKKGAKHEATETYLKVAKFYSEQGFYLKAVAVYKQILKLDPRLVEVNLKLAELYRQLGLLSDAMQHFEMVAAFFHREGKTKEALATIRQLVDLDPENVATRIKLAELYSKEGMVDDAVAEFGHACDYLRKHNRQDDFIKVAERLLWHKPDNLELNRELATLYLRRGDSRRALQKLQTCFKANPRDVDTLGLLAQAFQALDQKGKTVSVLKEMARVLVEAGKRREAEDVHRRILGFVPNDPDSKAFLGNQRPARESVPQPQVAEQVLEPAPRRTAARPAAVINPTGSLPVVNLDDLDDEARGLLEELDSRATEDLRRGSSGRLPAINDFDVSEPSDLVAELALEDEGFESADSSVRGEVHADEIAKILTETDVYVKYGLHQKAIDHLRKVFELDPYNLEARERLKDILLTQGRAAEAVSELLRMAEQVAPSDPERAEIYLRELVRVSPDDQRAVELAQRYRLDLTGADEVEIVDEPGSAVGSGLLGGGMRRAAGSGARPAQLEDELDFDDLDLDAGDELSAGEAPVAVGERSAPYQRNTPPPIPIPRVQPKRFESDGFEFELDGDGDDDDAVPPDQMPTVHGGEPETMEVQLDQVEEAVSIADLDSDELDFDAPPPGGAEFQEPGDDLPFDPADARRFDAERGHDEPAAGYGAYDPAGYGGEDYPPPYDPDGFAGEEEPGYDQPVPQYVEPQPVYSGRAPTPKPFAIPPIPRVLPEERSVPVEFDDDDGDDEPAFDYVATAAVTPLSVAPAPEPTLHTQATGQTIETPLEIDASGGERAPTALEDDLDEADFFMGQGLWDEARDILSGLLARFPGHPLVTAKLRDVEAMASGEEAAPGLGEPPVDIDDLGEPIEMPAVGEDDEYVTVPPPMRGGAAHPPGAAGPTKPVVLLEKPVEDSDAETHYDLGLAYKEMGLHDEAIKAFQKVLTVSGREVQCHLMIGLCHREQGNLSEAINQFKAGLYVDPITLAEKFGLYYEIGNAYEDLEDPQEALYYYEMVLKKDPGYRDVAQRVQSIRAAAGGNGNGTGGSSAGSGKRQSTLDSDTDSALDHLKR